MMTEISARTVSTGSYETDYEDIYKADHDITTAETDNLSLPSNTATACSPSSEPHTPSTETPSPSAIQSITATNDR